MAEYQITAETQTEFLNTINVFWDSGCASQADRNQHTQNTQLLVDMFKQADIALNGMDLVAETTRVTNPQFYADYKQARRMVMVGTGSLAVRGTVVNAHTGEPIQGATLTFYEIDGSTNKKGAVVLVKKSAAKGGFNVKNLSKGNYLLMVEMNEFATVEMNVSVNDKLQELKIALTAN